MVIKWFPYEIPVITTKMPKNEFGEFFFYPSPRIHISDELKGIVYSSTLLHEILEMVNEMHDLGLTEGKIRTLEVSIHQILTQNPHLGEVLSGRPLESSESDPGDEHGSQGLLEPQTPPKPFAWL